MRFRLNTEMLPGIICNVKSSAKKKKKKFVSFFCLTSRYPRRIALG